METRSKTYSCYNDIIKYAIDQQYDLREWKYDENEEKILKTNLINEEKSLMYLNNNPEQTWEAFMDNTVF